MSRFKGSKPIPQGALPPSGVGVLPPLAKPAPSPSITSPTSRPSQIKTPWRPAGATAMLRRSELDNPLRKLGLYLALAFVFCRFSLLGELVESKLNFDPHLVRILGVPTIVLALITGGLWRVLKSRISYVWLGLFICMVLSVPLSYWPGGSTSLLLNYSKAQLPMILIVGGFALTWKESKLFFMVIALACTVNVLSGKFFVLNPETEGRLTLELGTIGNANDFTAHLFFVLPFVVFVLLMSDRGWLRRILCLGVLSYGLYSCAATGSRGGLVAFAAICLFVVIRAPSRVRIGTLGAITAMLLVVLAVLPQTLIHRYATLFTSDSDDREAIESTQARTHLLKASIRYTLKHPILGVGPGEFSDYEAADAKSVGAKGAWQVTHNAYTQISSENGIPALLLFLTAIAMNFRTFGRVYRAARYRPDLRSMAMACFCCQLSIVGFCTATFFLSLAYTMYLPAMSGLAIAVSGALQRELAGQS